MIVTLVCHSPAGQLSGPSNSQESAVSDQLKPIGSRRRSRSPPSSTTNRRHATSGSADHPRRQRCGSAIRMCRSDIPSSAQRRPPSRFPADAAGGALRRRRAATGPGSHRPPPADRAAERPAGRRTRRLGDVGQSTAGTDGGVRCCAGCDCRRWATGTDSPRPRYSAATAVAPRMHAIACRIEQRTAGRWQVVALHIG